MHIPYQPNLAHYNGNSEESGSQKPLLQFRLEDRTLRMLDQIFSIELSLASYSFLLAR